MSQANGPEIADQNVETVADTMNPQPGQEPALQPTPEPEVVVTDRTVLPNDVRNQIAARFAQQQQEEYAEAQRLQDEAQDEDQPPAPPAEPAPPPPPPIYKLKVIGEEFDVDRAQLLKIADMSEEEAKGLPDKALITVAQKAAAAHRYLIDAKEHLKAARSAPSSQPSTTGADDRADNESDPTPAPAAKAQPGVREKLKQAIEKIQLEDPEAAVDTLGEAVANVMTAQHFAVAENNVRQQVQAAFEDFKGANADLANGVPEQLVVASAMDEIVTGLVKAGKLDPDDAPMAKVNAPATLQAYVKAKAEGARLPDPATILATAADKTRTMLGRPSSGASPQTGAQPTPSTTSRTEQKRQLQTQPSRATVPPQQGQPLSAVNGGMSPVVAAMRKARGQPVG